jgi:hypothetical protein
MRPRHDPVDAARAAEGPERQRRRRNYSLVAAGATAALLLVTGLGMEIGVDAGQRDESATPPTSVAPPTTASSTTTTEPPPTTGTETEVIAAELMRLDGRDGDLTVTVIVTIDPTWAGAAALHVEASDPTGQVVADAQSRGIGAGITVVREGAARETVWMGDTPSSCEGFDPDQQPSPAQLDERHTVTSVPGPASLELTVVSSACTTSENRVKLDTDLVFP